MPKDVFQFPCPCCGKMVEVETRSGKARAVRPEEAKGGTDLDQLLQKQKRESERLGSLFDDVKQQQARQAERLEDALRRAKDEAKRDPKDEPPRPIDFD